MMKKHCMNQVKKYLDKFKIILKRWLTEGCFKKLLINRTHKDFIPNTMLKEMFAHLELKG